MSKEFDLFVRVIPDVGVSVAALSHPNYAAFAESEAEAKKQLVVALERGIYQFDIATWETTAQVDLKQKRIELTLRTLQAGRVVEVPMKFTVLYHPRSKERSETGFDIEIPRLGVEFTLMDLADVEAMSEEKIRNALHMASLERLMEVAYLGEERLAKVDVASKTPTEKARKTKRHSHAGRKEPAVLPPVLSDVCQHLSSSTVISGLGRAHGRNELATQLKSELSNRNSVLLIGERGVGKTALTHELIQQERASKGSQQNAKEWFATSGSRLVAGMRYLGMWQERVEELIGELRTRPSVLVIENLPELLQTGDGETGLDLASLLLSAISTKDIVVVIEATSEELSKAQRTHPALVASLKPLLVPALPAVDAHQALTTAALQVAHRQSCTLEEDAVDQAAAFAVRFDSETALPGSAIQLLREAGSLARASGKLDSNAVINAFCRRSGYPRSLVDPAENFEANVVHQNFEERVLGQPEVARLMTDLVVTVRAGLMEGGRPLGSFLLMGPTGVGKTESAKSMAQYFFGDAKKMIRIDMAEFAAPGSAARLLSTRDGGLVARVRQNPYGVVLFDEVEKADSGVHDLLLQLLGEGRLSDAAGRQVNFFNTVVFVTSNLGADTEGRRLGFGEAGANDRRSQYLGAARHFFRPELLGRFDHIVPFGPLSRAVVRSITERAIDQALAREGLTRRHVTLHVTDQLREAIAEQGYQPRYGARPINRAVERMLVIPLARHLSSAGSSANATQLVIDIADGVTVVRQIRPA